NGESITIAVGASSGTVSTSVSNDVYQGHAAVSNSITAVSGGSYENLVASPNPVRTTVTDTQDTTTISLSATPTVAEGGSIVYTATLTNAAGTAVNVILSTGQLITVAAGQTSASVSVAAPADDVYLDTTAVSAHIASASGGNFENLAINSTPAVTQVTDTLNTSTVTLTATPNVAEGGAIIYTAAVSAPVTVSPVVVTLANGQSITIAVGASSGSVSVVVSNDVYQGHAPVTNSITSVSGGNYENLIANSGLVSTAVTDTTDNTTLTLTGSTAVVEGATASYTLTLSNPAQTDVTVKLSYTGTATNGSDYTGVTTVLIKAGTSQSTFSVPTIKDSITEGTEQFTVKVDSATGGNFEGLLISGAAGSVTTQIFEPAPVLDLDGNDSSGKTGADYQFIYTENGSGGSIADIDISVTDFDSSQLTGATVTLTNRQAGDTLNLGNSVNGIAINANSTEGKVVLTLSGTATLADYVQAIKNITFLSTSEDPSTTPRVITVTVTDGVNTSNTATTTVNVVAVNDAPVTSGGAVTGIEDTDLVLGWGDFNVSDVDSAISSLGVTITKLPDLGTLKFNSGTGWVNVTVNQTISQADIAAGKLKFVPVANQSGADGYGGTGVGNKQADYAQLKFKPTDGVTPGSEATLRVDITPVADKPDLAIGSAS
uniref:immunoglobulin-like domain-containing protein n=1 Tax=Pseudomonas fluorescens TaxID=294 RepID=UPI00214B7EBD